MEQLDLVLKSINEKIIVEVEETKKNELSKEGLNKKLNELKNMLENYDSDSVKVMEEIGVIEGCEDKCKEISGLISKYEYDEAVIILNEILQGN